MQRKREVYGTVYADPPWQESGGGKVKRGADRHYPLMKLEDIVRSIWLSGFFSPQADAHMYLWVTNNFLPEGLEVMRQLGFRYVTNTVWVKMWNSGLPLNSPPFDRLHSLEVAQEHLQIGLGQYQRGAHELLLFGVRGQSMIPEPKDRLPSVVFHPRLKHSEKPEVFRERIERVSPPPYLELFARRPAENSNQAWTVWGNEV